MKDFLKFTFASVIGVILAGVVFTILGIITLVGIVASSDTETMVKDNSIFVLDFKGSLSERVQENSLQQLLGEEFEAYETGDAKYAHLLDNFQPLLLNHASGGKSWAEHGVKRSQIYKRNEKMEETSKTVWECVKAIVEENIEKGTVKAE